MSGNPDPSSSFTDRLPFHGSRFLTVKVFQAVITVFLPAFALFIFTIDLFIGSFAHAKPDHPASLIATHKPVIDTHFYIPRSQTNNFVDRANHPEMRTWQHFQLNEEASKSGDRKKVGLFDVVQSRFSFFLKLAMGKYSVDEEETELTKPPLQSIASYRSDKCETLDKLIHDQKPNDAGSFKSRKFQPGPWRPTFFSF